MGPELTPNLAEPTEGEEQAACLCNKLCVFCGRSLSKCVNDGELPHGQCCRSCFHPSCEHDSDGDRR